MTITHVLQIAVYLLKYEVTLFQHPSSSRIQFMGVWVDKVGNDSTDDVAEDVADDVAVEFDDLECLCFDPLCILTPFLDVDS